jgi:hypothetical protein
MNITISATSGSKERLNGRLRHHQKSLSLKTLFFLEGEESPSLQPALIAPSFPASFGRRPSRAVLRYPLESMIFEYEKRGIGKWDKG